VQQAGINTVPNTMLLEKGCVGNETIVIRKRLGGFAGGFGLFGIDTDVGYLEREKFWKLFVGKILTFTWRGTRQPRQPDSTLIITH